MNEGINKTEGMSVNPEDYSEIHISHPLKKRDDRKK
jgi:hypothetical protein